MPDAVNRRTFLAALSAAAAASGVARTLARAPRLETLTDWMNASKAGCRAEDEPQNRRGDTRVAQGLLDSCASVM